MPHSLTILIHTLPYLIVLLIAPTKLTKISAVKKKSKKWQCPNHLGHQQRVELCPHLETPSYQALRSSPNPESQTQPPDKLQPNLAKFQLNFRPNFWQNFGIGLYQTPTLFSFGYNPITHLIILCYHQPWPCTPVTSCNNCMTNSNGFWLVPN